MQIILNLFTAIASVLSGIFSNTQSLQSQVLQGFSKLANSLGFVATKALEAKQAADAADQKAVAATSTASQAKSKADMTSSRLDDVVNQTIPSAKTEVLQSAQDYTLMKFNELRTSVSQGIRGVAALNITKDDIFDVASKISKFSDVFTNGTGQYFWDTTILDGGGKMTDGTAILRLNGVDYAVSNDEKVVVQVDIDANTISFVKIDSNYTNSVLSGLQSGLEQVKAVADAAKAQTDANKVLIDEFLLTI